MSSSLSKDSMPIFDDGCNAGESPGQSTEN